MKYFLLVDPPQSGAVNMARDEFLFRFASGQAEKIVIFRFYTFSPACLSLGVFQSSKGIDLPWIHSLGMEVIRRPTGGRAVLHQYEITYSIVFPLEGSIFSGSIKDSYRKISELIKEVLEQLKIDCELSHPDLDDYQENFDCFRSPSYFELIHRGKKILGSAQKREKNCCLQHGSLLLKRDPELSNRIFQESGDYPELQIDFRSFVETMVMTLEKKLKIKLTPCVIPPDNALYLSLIEKYRTVDEK
ncbi:MAG: hypothetical protein PHW04_10835 [Candidatus Wallbacteria bacterium]|nr:hypothetical protein [Candidatus Wallbacteria bacterium]